MNLPSSEMINSFDLILLQHYNSMLATMKHTESTHNPSLIKVVYGVIDFFHKQL